MHKSTAAVFVVLLSIILNSTLFSCSGREALEEKKESGVQTDGREVNELDVKAMENDRQQLVFDISIDEFIAGYNSAYRKDHGEDYLPVSHEWPFYNTMAIHSDNEALCHHFSEDESVRAVPKISVFAPTTDDTIQHIMVSYDDHSYSIPTYRMYEEMCFYALKTMLPELGDDEITEICARLNDLADENITDVPYSSEAAPCALYHRDGVGVYPYYCIGEELRFCIIPVTEDTLQEFEDRGVAIITLQN